MNVREFLSRVESHSGKPTKPVKDGWLQLCPTHDDRDPSLSVREGDDGKVLLYCRAGCATEDVLAALGIEVGELFPRTAGSNGGIQSRSRIVERYPYVDEQGQLLFEAVRFEPKDFKQRRPDGKDGWVWNLDGTRRVLFKLPEVLAAISAGITIYVVEGEKDAEALAHAGAVATCNPMGAGKWRDEYTETLRGAEVVIVADVDAPGLLHARSVRDSLAAVAASVKLTRPATGKDVSDHLAAGKTLDELVPEPEPKDLPRAATVENGARAPEHVGNDASQPPVDGAELLDRLLDELVVFVRRFVVVSDRQAVAVVLWVVHTYVYDTCPATPYLHAHSPEPGSGKSTLLQVLSVLARAATLASNLTEAVLFRLIDQRHPSLLFDEVDAVFAKKNSDSTFGITQVLNSGYEKGSPAWRCLPPNHEVKPYDVYCPKALAGLHELPPALAHRAVPIDMQPPLPGDRFEDFDKEEIGAEADQLRNRIQAWAEVCENTLRDRALKPAKLEGLDSRANQIWRILFRIADLAGGAWPEKARDAAVELSGKGRHHVDTSAGVRLLGHVRDVFDEEKMTCRAIVEALNADEELLYGGWSDGKGITTRELGKKLAPYGVRAKTVRVDEVRGNGYERDQFEDAWSRYLPTTDALNRDTVTTGMVEPKTEGIKTVTAGFVTVEKNSPNPHGYSDVTVVTVESAEESAKATVTCTEPLLHADQILSGWCRFCQGWAQ